MLFDPVHEIIISADALLYGLGAVLSQKVNGVERPVWFSSRTLSQTEQNYAQVHNKALALIFSVQKFYKYIYGHKFTLITDHQPLKAILGPNSNIPTLAHSRLQRYAIILSAYKYNMCYKKR